MTDNLGGRRLDALLDEACARFAGSPALVDDASTVTYGVLAERARLLSGRLAAAGHRPGRPVLLAVDNRCADLVCQLAAWRNGAVVVPVHRGSPAAAVAETAGRTGAEILLGDPAGTPESWEALLETGRDDWVRRLGAPASGVPAELDAGQALVMFTSGSTGRPKGVVVPHDAFAAKLDAIAAVLPFGSRETTLHVLQLNFAFGQWTSLLTLLTGGTVHLVPRFTAEDVLRRLAARPFDRVAVVPSMIRMILAELDDPAVRRRQAAAAGSPGVWITGGEPLSAGAGRRLRELLPGSGIADVYGLSETSTSDFILTADRYDLDAGTIGRPGPRVTFMIAASDGTPCPEGVTGELWLRTPYLMTGYLDDPEATAATMTDGWFRTGDLARVPPGRDVVELMGRSKHLIVRGGIKISPLEIQARYAEHPRCAGCLAVGMPDDLLNERVHLLFVPRGDTPPDEAELRTWARDRLEPYKVPDRVHIVADLPAGRTGKADTDAARRLVAELLGAAGGGTA
ncbi:class I adenylate-forming enzyme family protein [Streptosporangium sp. DT93]|uniref:class I adenylate-forming enzyme family protein n=1 Tax=Streptosporangium sp. DT93 TaxID=3393428 RepID=UPI003CEC56DD